jgi:hypothetical protein
MNKINYENCIIRVYTNMNIVQTITSLDHFGPKTYTNLGLRISTVFIHSHLRATVLYIFFNLRVLPHKNSSSVFHDCYSYIFLPNHD